MRLRRFVGFGLDDQPECHQARDDAIHRTGARHDGSAGFPGDDVLDGVAVEGAASEREKNVVLEGAHWSDLWGFRGGRAIGHRD